MVLSGQHHARSLPKGGRAAAQIHRHVKHLALRHAHQLALRLLNLVVQAAQHALGPKIKTSDSEVGSRYRT